MKVIKHSNAANAAYTHRHTGGESRAKILSVAIGIAVCLSVRSWRDVPRASSAVLVVHVAKNMNVEILLALIFVIILFISRLHYSPCVMTFRCLKRNKTVLLVFALCCLWVSGHAAILADVKSKKNKNDSISWLKKIADKGQEANLKAKTEKYDFKKIFSDDIFDIDTLRKTSFEILDTGIPSKVGYGFLMGYTSGFCLKKVRNP